MPPFPADHVNKIMKKLMERKTSSLFLHPVDETADDCPDYYKLIKKPMDLETIRKKIDSGRYKTVAEWRADVELIWSNSLQYHHYDIMCLITKDLQEYFRDISNELSDFPEIDWSTRLNRLESELHGLMQNMPKAIKPRVRHVKKQQPLPDSAKSKKKFTVFTADEVQRLTRDIFNIKNNEHLLQLVNILVKNESSLDMNGESMDVQMNSLRPQTLHELRSAVDGFIATV